MKLYRIAKSNLANDLTGIEASKKDGRWHTKGHFLIYASENRSLAKLEKCVHLEEEPHNLCLITLSLPLQFEYENINPNSLPKYWNKLPYRPEIQSLGNTFIHKSKYLMLKVPSAVICNEFNYILNPRHPLIKKVSISNVESLKFDPRLLKKMNYA